ncbi:MAG: hypothetical protein PHN72_05090 [Bacilli bacterium]|nr:hypothetical protein [Bacilli bacterium]
MKIYIKKHYPYLLLLFIISIVIMLIAGNQTNHLGHDMYFHVSNIKDLEKYLDIFKGRVFAPPIIDVDGIGYGLYLFYPSLPHLIYAYGYKVLSLFSISIFDSILYINIMLTMLSTFVMYHLSYKLSKSRKIACLTGLLFLFFPYRLSNYFIRYALNESLTFLFIPLILLGLYYFKENKTKAFFLCFVIGYTGLLYSHLVIAFYFTLFLFPYLILYRKEFFKKGKRFLFIKAVGLVSFLFLPFLIGVLEQTFLPYLVYKEGYMTSVSLVTSSALKIRNYITPVLGDWLVTLYIPLVTILLFLLSLFYLFLKRKEEDSFYKILLWIGVLAFLGTLTIIPWAIFPSFFTMIQFSWRLETLLVIVVPLIAPLCTKSLPKKYMFPLLILLILGTQSSYLFFLNNRQYYTNEKEITAIKKTGNIQEYYLDSYLENKDYYENRGSSLLTEKGSGEINVIKKGTSYAKWHLKNASTETEVELPLIYYVGYQVKKDGKNISYTSSKQGFILVTGGDGEYEIKYEGTPLKRGITYFSILGVVTLFSYPFIQKKFSKKKK